MSLSFQKVAAVLAGLLAFGVVQAAPASNSPIPVSGSWAVSLDAQGRVTELRQTTALKPLLAEPVERALRNWSFQPGKVDGSAQATDTTVTVLMALQEVDKGYAIRVTDVRTGGRVGKVPPLSIDPRDVPRKPVGYTMRVAYDAAGKVVSSEPADGAPKVSSSLRYTFKRLVTGMTFVPERVAGNGVAAEVIVPICLSAGVNGQKDECTWKAPGSDVPLREGESMALNPEARLLSDVIGHAL